MRSPSSATVVGKSESARARAVARAPSGAPDEEEVSVMRVILEIRELREITVSDNPTETETSTPTKGKGAPTPKRREAQARNRRPLVPEDRKAAKKEARQALTSHRERARIGYMNGEERYLPARDKGSQKRFVRDFVDSKFRVGEAFMVIAVLFILLSFIPQFARFGVYTLWAFVLIMIGDAVIAMLVCRKRIRAVVGKGGQEPIMFYGVMRCIQMRWMRQPRPQVKRGAKVEFHG